MRIHAFMLILAACGGTEVAPLEPMEKDELAYDESSSNLKARGMLLGEAIDILEVRELEAVQEYEAPALPGTDEPDVSQKRLVSVEVKGIVMRSGAPWEVQLDIEGDDLGNFSTGSLAPSEAVDISFQLEDEADTIDLEDDASSGSLEIKRYDDHFGGVFNLTLEKGDQIQGAFFVPFSEPEIDVE